MFFVNLAARKVFRPKDQSVVNLSSNPAGYQFPNAAVAKLVARQMLAPNKTNCMRLNHQLVPFRIPLSRTSLDPMPLPSAHWAPNLPHSHVPINGTYSC